MVPLDDVVLYPPMDEYIRGSAWLLTVVVMLVLLLACTNLASFLLARALDRPWPTRFAYYAVTHPETRRRPEVAAFMAWIAEEARAIG